MDYEFIEKVKKVGEATEFFGGLAFGLIVWLLARWRLHKEHRPRALIAAQDKKIEALANLVAELAKSVTANSENIIGVTDQVGAINSDNETRWINSGFVRQRAFDDLVELVGKHDDRIFELAGAGGRPGGGVNRRGARRDTGD